MKLSDLSTYYEDPSLLNRETLPELNKLMDSFPYFEPIRYLYLKNALTALSFNEFLEQLADSAIYIQDKIELLDFLNDARLGWDASLSRFSSVDPDNSDNTLSKIEGFLDKRNGKANQETQLRLETVVPVEDLLSNLTQEKSDKSFEFTGRGSALFESLDEFVTHLNHSNNPKSQISPIVTPEKIETIAKEIVEPTLPPIPTSTIPPNPTPTLSKQATTIYRFRPIQTIEETKAYSLIQEGKIDEAIQCFKSLSLNNPKKSVYFADQIRYWQLFLANIN